MKKTNDAARPTILRLLEGGPFLMNLVQRRAFSTWATMLSMTHEFGDINTLVTPQHERTELRREGKPPPNWAVLVGLFLGGEWVDIQNHRAFRTWRKHEPMPQSSNAQCNLFTIGRTAVVTLSGPITDLEELTEFADMHSLYVVWPLILNSPGAGRKAISDEQMWDIACYMC